MKEFVISEAKTETAVLVGIITPGQDEAKTMEYLDELEFLATTAGAHTVRRFTQRVGGPSSVTYIGSGKLQEIKEYIRQVKNPYCFRVGDVVVKCSYSNDGVTLRDRFRQLVRTL